jgi:hypothetical protein
VAALTSLHAYAELARAETSVLGLDAFLWATPDFAYVGARELPTVKAYLGALAAEASGVPGSPPSSPAPVFDRVLVDAANDVHTPQSAHLAQLFFITAEDPVWDEAKSAVSELPNDGASHQLVFDFAGNTAWRGTVVGLRFDPFNCVSAPACLSACFNMRSVEVTSRAGTALSGARWDFAAGAQSPVPNPFAGWSHAFITATWAQDGAWGGCVDGAAAPGAGLGDPQVQRVGLSLSTGR